MSFYRPVLYEQICEEMFTLNTFHAMKGRCISLKSCKSFRVIMYNVHLMQCLVSISLHFTICHIISPTRLPLCCSSNNVCPTECFEQNLDDWIRKNYICRLFSSRPLSPPPDLSRPPSDHSLRCQTSLSAARPLSLQPDLSLSTTRSLSSAARPLVPLLDLSHHHYTSLSAERSSRPPPYHSFRC